MFLKNELDKIVWGNGTLGNKCRESSNIKVKNH